MGNLQTNPSDSALSKSSTSSKPRHSLTKGRNFMKFGRRKLTSSTTDDPKIDLPVNDDEFTNVFDDVDASLRSADSESRYIPLNDRSLTLADADGNSKYLILLLEIKLIMN